MVATSQPFIRPVHAAFARYLQRFHAQIVPDTPAVAEFAARQFGKSFAWAPARMIDAVEDMLDAWRANDSTGAPRAEPRLPVVLLTPSPEYMPLSPDLSRQAATPLHGSIPADPKGRIFGFRVALFEQRVQLVIIAPDPGSAASIAMQLQMWCSSMENRRFTAAYVLAGMPEEWPVQIEQPEVMGSKGATEAKNITILIVDVNLRASIPLISAPAEGDADSDGQGTHPITDPHGYAPLDGIGTVSRSDADTVL